MKNTPHNLKKWASLCGIAGLFAILLSSCAKNNNTVVSTPLAGLAVVNASPDAGPVDFFIGSSKITGSALSLGDYTFYFSAYSGKSSGIFYQTGTSNIIDETSLNLTASTYYTLFLANVKATPDLVLLKDSVYKPTTGYTNIRFVDLSPDAPAVDFVLKGGAKIASNVSYKGYTGFLPVLLPSGTALDTLQIVQTGTSTVLATVPPTNYIGTADYTVWFYGLANTTVAGEGLNAGVMEDVYFN
jgi:hypothetical protein